jgi:hypothetical protein
MSDFAPMDGLVPRPPQYHSYLLRFWEERGETDASTIWRFMLQDPQTDERFGFPDLDALMVWLHDKIMPRTDTAIVTEPKGGA